MRYKSLDGLRGAAAMMVVICHYSSQLKLFNGVLDQLGTVGVMIFFTLSGFLMGRLYLVKRPSVSNIALFYQHRFARVAPLYYAVVLGSFALYLTRGQVWPLYYSVWDNLAEQLLFVRSTNVLWTIPVEVQFYALFPIFWLAFSRSKDTGIIVALTFLFLVFFIDPMRPPSFLAHLPYFVGGVLVSVLAERRTPAAEWVFCLLPVAIGASIPEIRVVFGLAGGPYWPSPLFILLMPLILVVTLRSRVAEVVLGNSAAAFLGAISYSVYLLHMPVFNIVRYAMPDAIPASIFAVGMVATVCVATSSFLLIERKSQKALNSARVLEAPIYARDLILRFLLPRRQGGSWSP